MSRNSVRWSAHRPFFQRTRYRVGQFWHGLTARVSTQERSLAAQILPADAMTLFDRMPVDAQRHSLDVLHTVRSMAAKDPDLDAAALLHDAGKLASHSGGVSLGLWLRGPLVLLEAWSPRSLARVASPEPKSGWRYTAFVHLEHPRIGAELAKEAGCSDLTCWLIRHHQEDWRDLEGGDGGEHALALLAVLQAADGSR